MRKLANSSQRDVLMLWSGLGYNNRALRLRKAAQAIVEQFKGEVPNKYEDLLALPGIGDYTARAILAFAFNQDIVTVDTNIRRILIHECNLSEATSPEDLLAIAQKLLPKGKSREWHSALMDYGAMYLTSRKTRIAPISRQGKFLHSTRWYRGRIVKLLLKKDKVTLQELCSLLEKNKVFLREVLDNMKRDNLLTINKRKSKLVVQLKE